MGCGGEIGLQPAPAVTISICGPLRPEFIHSSGKTRGTIGVAYLAVHGVARGLPLLAAPDFVAIAALNCHILDLRVVLRHIDYRQMELELE